MESSSAPTVSQTHREGELFTFLPYETHKHQGKAEKQQKVHNYSLDVLTQTPLVWLLGETVMPEVTVADARTDSQELIFILI